MQHKNFLRNIIFYPTLKLVFKEKEHKMKPGDRCPEMWALESKIRLDEMGPGIIDFRVGLS
jgi:hypothetical protein